MNNIGFIGTGNMGGALISGILKILKKKEQFVATL